MEVIKVHFGKFEKATQTGKVTHNPTAQSSH